MGSIAHSLSDASGVATGADCSRGDVEAEALAALPTPSAILREERAGWMAALLEARAAKARKLGQQSSHNHRHIRAWCEGARASQPNS